MSADFPVGCFVRYRDGGPRAALRGCVGVVAAPSDEGKKLGWIRANCNASYDDYASNELELAQFWVMEAFSNKLTLGPYPTWEIAVAGLSSHIRSTVEYGDNHPLNAKRDRLVSEISDSEPVPNGRRFTSEIGCFVIKPAGQMPPKLYDEKGRAYA